MERQLAEATADKLRDDNRVDRAEVRENNKGVFVKVTATDRYAKGDLKADLSEYPVYVKVTI